MTAKSDRRREKAALRRLLHLLRVVNGFRQKSGQAPLTLAIVPDRFRRIAGQ